MDRKNSVKEILIKCMPQETDLTEISEDTNIYEDLQYDSLAIVELLTAIEEEFGVDFFGYVGAAVAEEATDGCHAQSAVEGGKCKIPMNESREFSVLSSIS